MMYGFLSIDKPSGCSSFDVIRRLRKITGIKKMGHAGTLDPIATGLLIVAVGEATKLLPLLEYADKTYEVVIHLGAVSDTYDREGNITLTNSGNQPTAKNIQAVLHTFFTGEQQQVPPAFSAVHVNGQRAYQAARAGKEVILESRMVTFYDTVLQTYEWPLLTLKVHCSKGTYIRSMAHDLGQILACGGYVEQLRRFAIGDKTIKNSCSLDQLEESLQKDAQEFQHFLVPPEKFLLDVLPYNLTATEYHHLAQGGFLPYEKAEKSDGPFLALFEGKCVGTLEVFQERWLKFQRRFNFQD